MNIKSYAKINLSLKNLGKREDGYHELEMINLPLALHDVIEIDRLPFDGDTYITCNDLRLIGMKGNLCTQAFEAMKQRYGFKDSFRISIHKNIPFAAGLGGGSSDAASVLLAVNKILKLGASMDELKEIGLRLGADVPYFLDPSPMKVFGIGEKMEKIDVKGEVYCLIAKPIQGLSTKDVYACCDNFPKEAIDTEKVIESLAKGDLKEASKYRGNDLYPAANSLLPEVGEIVRELEKEGFEIAAMSGSGSACYGLTKDRHLALKAERHFLKTGHVVRLTKILN